MESSLEPPYRNHYTQFFIFVNNGIIIKRKNWDEVTGFSLGNFG